jgi:hypothetical protein
LALISRASWLIEESPSSWDWFSAENQNKLPVRSGTGYTTEDRSMRGYPAQLQWRERRLSSIGTCPHLGAPAIHKDHVAGEKIGPNQITTHALAGL